MGGNFTLDKSYIYQVSIREWIENDWDKGIFVPVYGERKDDGRADWRVRLRLWWIDHIVGDAQADAAI